MKKLEVSDKAYDFLTMQDVPAHIVLEDILELVEITVHFTEEQGTIFRGYIKDTLQRIQDGN